MANAGGMIVHDGIGPVLGFMVATTAIRVAGAMREGAAQVESYAKMNAPWSDITGNAREGLTASVYEEYGEIVLELAHSVDYGYWLEVIQSGAYAIIMPTLEAVGPEVIHHAGGVVMTTGSTF